MTYIDNIYLGKIPMTEERDSYFVLNELALSDARHVRKVADCIVISFAFMPTDAIPQLIYAPRGLKGLPEHYNAGMLGDAVVEFQRIDEHWFYCRYDPG